MASFISVVIITYNEEKNIGRCIDSIQSIADEIIVLDSGSTDQTISMAKEKGAIVHHQPFLGYVEQKNKALTLANHEFVLSLDADEAIDEKLAHTILHLKNNQLQGAYSMNRCTSYCGKFIRHGLWYPDKKIRLFNKNIAIWQGDNPHDKIMLANNKKPQHLPGDILHFSYNNMEEHITQNNRFSSIAATALFQKGKRTNIIKLLFNPFWAFINGYFFRLGFLDGFYGWVIAINTSQYTFLKHSKLYQLQKNSK
ncbi:MAG: glycosyltransferase family 2 protein [Chitinophagaceae bacterium]|nr:glycosyltransferase family 2 protein [Chitinophagaceae bacterium]